jgi:hypothetical protein
VTILLETDRLVLRSFTEDDVDRLYDLNSDPEVMLEKCGLVLIRAYHSDDVPAIPGAEHGEVEYALTREDWQARDGAAPSAGA